MRVCVLEGSPERTGNTMQLAAPFLEELRRAGAECSEFFLYEMAICPCIGCRACQYVGRNVAAMENAAAAPGPGSAFGCSQQDGMQEIFDAVMAADLIVVVSPIHTWYCTPPMKAALDRLVFGLNKYYGGGERKALAEGKRLALIMSCGYKPERGSDLLEEGMRRFCVHSRMEYLGSLTERDQARVFMDPEKEAHARAFAIRCLDALSSSGTIMSESNKEEL